LRAAWGAGEVRPRKWKHPDTYSTPEKAISMATNLDTAINKQPVRATRPLFPFFYFASQFADIECLVRMMNWEEFGRKLSWSNRYMVFGWWG
jgi:hypothetical protein